MNSILGLLLQIINLFQFILIIYIIGTWLVNFNIINTGNRFVFSVMEALYHLCDSLHDAPEVNSRGSKQKERIFQSFVIEDPTDLNITIPARKFNENYAIAEWLWYLSADGDAKNIGKLAKIWNMISDRHGQVESNYGIYLSPQWRWVVNELLNDNDTRRATFVINHSYHKYKNEKDKRCLRIQKYRSD